MKRRHLIFYAFVRPLVIAFTKLRFGFRYKKAENLPEKYIVLSNHLTDYDLLFLAASFKRQMYFVGSEHIARWKIYWLLKYAFEPIMRHKGAPATAAIMDILRKVRQGANVCMFAEGVRSWDGVTCPIQPATAKLIKTAGCGLVTYRLTGGYFASPMWSGASVRRGEVYGEPVRVFTAEEIRALSADEIYEIIVTDLYEDAYARQLKDPKPYRGKNLAVGLENVLFRCPECDGIDTFSSSGNTVSCKNCGMTLQYDIYGMLDSSKFPTVKALADWQKQKVQRDIEAGISYTAENCILKLIQKHEETILLQGAVIMTAEALQCGDMVFPMAQIADLAMHGQRTMVFTIDGKYYELRVGAGFNALKFMQYYNGCKEKQKAAII